MDESYVIIQMLCRQNWQNEWIYNIDFDKFISLAIKNKVLSPLSQFIFQNKIDHFFKHTSFYSFLKESLLLYDRDKKAYKEVLMLLCKTFADQEIETCLLKGLSLSGINPRDIGDLDLLIHPEDLDKAITIIEGMNFFYIGDKRNHSIRKDEVRNWNKLLLWSNQFEFFHLETGVLVELHTYLFPLHHVYHQTLEKFHLKINDFWERRVYSDELQCTVLSLEDKIWLLSMHNSLKRTAVQGGFVLRNMLDMSYILQTGKVKWNLLIERARDTDTLIFLVYTIEMTKIFFSDLPLEYPIILGNEYLSPNKKYLIKIMHSCYENLETFSYFNNILYRILLPFIQKSLLRDKLASLLIIPVLFPKRWRLRQIYGLKEESILVLFTYFIEPFRWFIIILKRIKVKLSSIK